MTPLVGGYMTRVFNGERTFLTPLLGPIEMLLYRAGGIDEQSEQGWFGYTVAKQILSAVWGPAHTAATQYLRVYIGQLRQKIERRPNEPSIVLTEPGIGYRILDEIP